MGGGKVIMSNNHTCQVEGINSVRMKMFDGMVRTIEDVRYVPSLSRTLSLWEFLMSQAMSINWIWFYENM